MKNKILIMIGTIILAIILFVTSTIAQRKLIKYEPKVKCLFLAEDINANELAEEEKFVLKDVDISLVANTKIVQDFSKIENLYARDNIYKGQLVIEKQFDTKENLKIYKVEDGKEKVSLKIKSSENGVSYSIKEKSKVNIYVTLRNDIADNFLKEKERLVIGQKDDGYTIIKLIDGVSILETYDIDGNRIKESDTKVIDTIMIAVTASEAKEINLLKDIGIFNVTGIGEF